MSGYPAFYDDVARLRLYEPLGAFLGAAAGGFVEYGYADVVKLAGHSCPTTAGAYLMTLRALRHLYGEEPPVRGDIEVFLPGDAADGTAGVTAGIVSFLTGAAQSGGFKGLGGRFVRRDLLRFGAAVDGNVAFRRADRGTAVQARFDSAAVPASEELRALTPRAIAGAAGPAEMERFRALWQDRLRRLLLDHAEDPRLVRLSNWAEPLPRTLAAAAAAREG